MSAALKVVLLSVALLGACALLAGCGENDGASANGARDAAGNGDFSVVRYDMTKRRLKGIAEEGARWKAERGGAPGSFEGVEWTDLVTRQKVGDPGIQQYDGDRYERTDWYSIEITSRNPLVLDAKLQGFPRRIVMTVPSNDPEDITLEESDL